jgi:hypothetical protein
MPDLRFYFDPVCPFAWMTAKWVRQVQAARGYEVEWRFISLRLLNSHLDYDTHFPADYEEGHTAGLRLLRVAAAARESHGPDAVDRLQQAFGAHLFEVGPDHDGPSRGSAAFLTPILHRLGLPAHLVEALDDEALDATIQAETDEALSLTGKDVGTPIINVDPDDDGGVAFFGPVISRLPAPDRAVELWDHVVGLARFPSFAELKRSLREVPQLPAFGVVDGTAGPVQDWRQGSRRTT